MSAPLAVGDRAWAIVQTPPTPSTRRTVLGAALVRIEVIEAEDFVARVLRGSGVPVGHRLRLKRHDLYARRDQGEHEAFGGAVARIFGAS
ncbi:MAG TPA: hypothetical protein VMI75_03530 [Polyangiaceae bacterium]|nr:hypothetical protein [Polyangiaceae bacterium]